MHDAELMKRERESDYAIVIRLFASFSSDADESAAIFISLRFMMMPFVFASVAA